MHGVARRQGRQKSSSSFDILIPLTACIVEMDYEGWFWLPWTVTIAVILLSLLVITRSLKKREIPSATAATAVNNTSSTSASASASGGEYEVFLSFRGADTRKDFTDFLYTYLVDAGIRTFRDDNELRAGEKIGPELLKAIEESKISIPIFSKNYASSKWCLLELSKMVDCQRNMGQKVLPIFYDVQPSDVKHQTGSYKNAFLQHKKRFDEKTVQGWKEALKEVGDLKGWELEKETKGHQGKLVKMVVSNVLLELKQNYMDISDNLVGMDHHVEKMRGLLNVDSNDVSIVGIHGMGGIGKTTIAKVIYNQLSEHFECCCFLTDVREWSQQHKDFVELQARLVSKILKKECPYIANDDEGINIIKNTVCRKKVLIVLDDVDKKYQFDKLVGKRNWFGSGSLIIVTTRNKDVLDQLEVVETYEPPMMELDHSLELFSRHAFRTDSPPNDYDILSRKIVSTAAGLPLALEIIGSLLLGKGKEDWEESLAKLQEIPDDEVLKKLIISYEALNHEQKQIFLDIAFLFIGEDIKYPWYMWDGCKFYPRNGINVLVLRSLVKIQDDAKFWMHDQIRDLGREIVRRQDFYDPGGRSRLWRQEDVSYLLESQMGTKKVEALILDQTLGASPLTIEEFGHLHKLRFLRVVGADLDGDFKHLLSELRWFECHHGCFAPTSFHLKNLVILDLSYCHFADDWDPWSQIKMSQKLKVLKLSFCTGLRRIPDLSTCATLEVLIITDSAYQNIITDFTRNLVQIDPSIWNLVNLRVLHITHCAIAEIPDSIGNLEKLEEMDASHCSSLKGEIPWSIGRLSSLKILRLDYTQICSLPTSVGKLSALRILRLDHTQISSLPTSVCGLSRLQTLHLMGCQKLKSLPELPHSLTNLQVTSGLMTTLPSLSNLVNLKELVFSLPCNLVEIPRDIGKLSKLETLILTRTNINSLPAEIGALSQLKKLKVQFCSELRFILGLPSSLFKLHLCHCGSLERLPDLSNLKNLSKLKLVDCLKLEGIQGLGKLESLTSLEVSLCKNIGKLDGLEQLESLRYLKVSCCESVERLLDLSNLKSLKELIIRGWDNLIEIRGLEELESFEVLRIFECRLIGQSLYQKQPPPDLSKLKLKTFECR